MADSAFTSRRMTTREFLEWEERQPNKHEFVDGLIRMMAGGTKNHDRIRRNLSNVLTVRLRGQRCEPFGPDMQVQTFPGPLYYPDMLVDCGSIDGDAREADRPTVIFEVLSKSTRETDLTEKLPNYQATPAVQEIVYIDQARMHCMVWRRTADGWAESEICRPDETLALASIGVALTFADLYEGVGWG